MSSLFSSFSSSSLQSHLLWKSCLFSTHDVLFFRPSIPSYWFMSAVINTVKMWLSSGAYLIFILILSQPLTDSANLFYCLRALNPFSFYCYHIFLNFFLLSPCASLNLLLPPIHLISAHTSFPLSLCHKAIKLSCQRPCINPSYISESP